jgi:uncharacterized 2Fe-2S/4Fe-4S cluster protein (DUF4445 family)
MPETPWILGGPVSLSQQDVRELQLAKGAVAAGMRILMHELKLEVSGIKRFYLAGAFGNNIDVENARAVGLLPFPHHTIHPVGNSALLGAKIALFQKDGGEGMGRAILPDIRHVNLEKDPEFQDWFAEEMAFPVIDIRKK